eukprot:3043297-Rhodomonas_salina.1
MGAPGAMAGAFMYDAVWAAAIAISRSKASSDGVGADRADVLRHARALTFVGASGDVVFDPVTGAACMRGSVAVHWAVSTVSHRV